MALRNSDIPEGEKEEVVDSINRHPKLPCGHFVENATPLDGIFAADFVCAACVHQGKSLREAFEVCARFLEDHAEDNMADLIRKLGDDPEAIDHHKAMIAAEAIEEKHGQDAAIAAVVQEAVDHPITIRDVERELGQLAHFVYKEQGLTRSSLSPDERRIYDATGGKGKGSG